MALPFATCTVVVPCYNGATCLEAAVRSVFAQSFRDFHLVLVDDKSQDSTLALARRLTADRPNCTVVELPENRGQAYARNRGTELTRGPFLAFLDQDDSYHPDFLRTTTTVLSRAPRADAIKVQPNISISMEPALFQVAAGSLVTTMLTRRGPFELVGGWPQSPVFRRLPGGCEDVAFLLLFSAYFNLGYLDQKLYNYTHRPGNALDLLLKRWKVIDGKAVLTSGHDEAQQFEQEVERLKGRLHDRIRRILLDRVGLGLADLDEPIVGPA